MALRAHIVPATREHAYRLGPVMRDEDVVEVYSMTGMLPVEAVEASINASSNAWACYFGNDIACVFGISPVNMANGVMAPWALTAEIVDRYPILFYKTSRQVIDWMRAHFPTLVNRIEARNGKAIAWARRVGFDVADPLVATSPNGYDYRYCHIEIRQEVR